jgi:hypothetical protein
MPLGSEVYGQEEKRKMEDVGCRFVACKHNDECIARDLFLAETLILGSTLSLRLGSLCII